MLIEKYLNESKESDFLKKLGKISDDLDKIMKQGSKFKMDLSGLKNAQQSINKVIFDVGSTVSK